MSLLRVVRGISYAGYRIRRFLTVAEQSSRCCASFLGLVWLRIVMFRLRAGRTSLRGRPCSRTDDRRDHLLSRHIFSYDTLPLEGISCLFPIGFFQVSTLVGNIELLDLEA